MPGDDPTALSLIAAAINRVEGKVDQGLARIETAMLNKADKGDIAEMRGEMAGHARRLSDLEEDRRLREARAEVHEERDDRQKEWWRSWWKVGAASIGAITSLCLAAEAVVQIVRGLHG